MLLGEEEYQSGWWYRLPRKIISITLRCASLICGIVSPLVGSDPLISIHFRSLKPDFLLNMWV